MIAIRLSAGVSIVSSQLIFFVLVPDPQANGAPQPAFTSPWKIPITATAAMAASSAEVPSLMTSSDSLARDRSRDALGGL